MSESIPSETDRQHDSAIKGADDEPAFDFEAHRHRAVEAYQALVPLYADFAQAVYSILRTCLEKEEIKVHSVSVQGSCDATGRDPPPLYDAGWDARNRRPGVPGAPRRRCPVRDAARESVAAGRLDQVEITPDALKSYLDKRLGPDGRMAHFSYEFEAQVLKRLGFADLRQLDLALSGYDDDALSRAVHGGRQGQLTRFEDVLLAAMGEEFIRRHPFMQGDNDWFLRVSARTLKRMRDAGVEIGEFRPELHVSDS